MKRSTDASPSLIVPRYPATTRSRAFTRAAIGRGMAAAVLAHLALAFSASAQNGWEMRSAFSNSASVWAVTTSGSRYAYAAHFYGYVLASSDRGETWAMTWTGSRSPLNALAFSDSVTGTVVGNSGTVLRTTDGGMTWLRQTNGPFSPGDRLTGVAFTDRDRGMIVSESGGFFRTINGGAGWLEQLLPGAVSALSGVSTSGNFAVVVGDSGRILCSTDGGASWASRGPGGSLKLRAVRVQDGARAVAVGDNAILRTTNAGLSWTAVTTAESSFWTTVTFIDTLLGFAGSYNGGNGILLRTTDGGATWVRVPSTIPTFYSLAFFDADTGIIATGNDPITLTTDGGRSGVAKYGTSAPAFLDVHALGPQAAIAVGSDGLIARTWSTGWGWSSSVSGTAADLFGIDCLDANRCTAVGDSGVILATTDGGESWSPQASGVIEPLRAVELVSASVGWVAGDDGTLLWTLNGGVSWIPRPAGVGVDLHEVAFVDAANGLVAGDSAAMLTTNGGTSWQSISLAPSFRFRGAAYPAESLLVMGGFFGAPGGGAPFIHFTTDQGASIRYSTGMLSFGDIQSISAPHPGHLYAAGFQGIIYRSVNRGLNWSVQPTPAGATLRGISMYDSTHGFAVGDEGTVLYTSDGGLYLWPPTPNSPVSGATVQAQGAVFFSWSHRTWPVYSTRLQVSTEDQFGPGLLVDATLPAATSGYVFPNPAYGRRYYWRLMAETGEGTTPWSPTYWFNTQNYASVSVNQAQMFRTDEYLNTYLLWADSNQNSSPGSAWLQTGPLNPADTVRLSAVCVIPPGELHSPGSAATMIVADLDSTRPSWSGLEVQWDASAAAGFPVIHAGDRLVLLGTAFDSPFPSLNSTTTFKATSAQVVGTGPIPAVPVAQVADFHLQGYPGGYVRYSRGEMWEGMIVELHDLMVNATFDTAVGFMTLVDGAGNEIPMVDASRWFTVRSHRDPASTYVPPAIGARISTLHGVIRTITGSENNRGYCIAPVYPADLVYGGAGDGSISGELFVDVDRDSVRGGADEPAPGLLVWLTGPRILTARTGNDGSFRFDRLAAGQYFVQTESRPGWIATTPPYGGIHTIELGEHEVSTGRDIGIYYQAGLVAGTVFNDRDQDSVWIPGDEGLAGRTVQLSGTASRTTVTDAQGNYHFDKLANGAYSVEVVDSLYWFRTFPGASRFRSATVSSTDLIADGLNFGFSFCEKLRFTLNVADDAGYDHDLWWGIRPGASYGVWWADPGATNVDLLEGEAELPPRSFPKIIGIFDARFQDPRYPIDMVSPRMGEGSWTDSRDFYSPFQVDTLMVSFLPSYAGGGDYPMSLRWDAAPIARSFTGPVTLDDLHGTVVDMKISGGIDITNPSIEYCLIVARGPILPASLASSWRLVSLPVQPDSPSVRRLYPGANGSAYSFDPILGYRANDSLEVGTGYWLKHRNTINPLALTGALRPADTVQVWSGWNLVGTLSSPLAAEAVATEPPGVTLGPFFGYDRGYMIADSLLPGEAYWVNVSQDGSLVLDASQPAAAQRRGASRAVSMLDAANRIRITDKSGSAATLYYSLEAPDDGVPPDLTDLRRFVLPPVPPPGGFDARFASGRMFESFRGGNAGSVAVLIVTPSYPVTLEWEGESVATGAVLSIGGKEYSLGQKGTAEITDPRAGVVLTIAEPPGLPTAFRLEQNHPNPFNPSTTIRFALPEASQVSIVVYDVLGRRVRTLLNEARDAGISSVAWDGMGESGSRLVNGVYFYRAEFVPAAAPGRVVVEQKKMILLK